MPLMPNVVGMEYQEATQVLTGAGIVVPNRWSIFAVTTITIAWQKSLSEPGLVLAQSPGAGDLVEPNSPTTLDVSQFPIGVVYP